MWRERNLILYKFYSPARVDVLERRILYFCHPSVFNDPFECEPFIEYSCLPEPAHMTNEAGVLRTKDELDFDHVKLQEQKRNILIVSLTEEVDNLLMWAHYGASHSGFAVGFDSTKESFTNRADGAPRRLGQVNYSYLRPRARTPEDVRDQELFLTKSLHWQHEREWRMFESPFNSDENTPVCEGVWGFRFAPDAVERIVLGCRIAADTEARIRAVSADPAYAHVKLLRMETDERNFRVVPRLEMR
jgi:hypothetical protein